MNDMPELSSQKPTIDVLRIFEDRTLAQWDLLDSIATEIKKSKP